MTVKHHGPRAVEAPNQHIRWVPQPTWNSASQHRDLARIKVELGKAAEAEALCFKAVQYDLARQPRLRASVLNTLGRARQLLGRTAEARADIDESIAIARSADRADSERMLAELLMLSARVHIENGEVDRALQEITESAAIEQQAPSMTKRIRNDIRTTLERAKASAEAVTSK